MKKIFVAMLALAAATACSNDELVSVNQEAIGFDNAFINNSVRSKYDPSFKEGNMFTDFAVYGYVEGAVLLDGVRVAQDVTNDDLTKSTWKYEDTQYWIAGAKYNFNAVAPMTDGGWEKAEGTNSSKTVLSFTNNGTTDLLYAYATAEGKVSGNALVGFTFRHVLSKVKFSFKNDYNATNATIRVKNVQITDAYKTGTVTLTDATVWSAQDDNTLTLNFGNAAVDAADAVQAFGYQSTLESYNELLLIPGAGKTVVDGKNTYTIKFTVDLLVSGDVVKSYNHTINAEFAPEAGNSYNLTATIDATNIDPQHQQEPIEFTVTSIGGWANGNTADSDDDNVNDHYPLN